ncbi:MAG: hypothetical protein DHS20C21_11590 [Gemmatimonadota bacterium]|nr:MAG: hypothetical protein DHS20C21_11590 [Gemmatimonadota bacterium]
MGAYEHFGSASDVVDYETEVTTFHWGAELGPVRGWGLTLEGAWTRSMGSFSTIDLELPHEVVAIADYDFSEVNTLSDLEYTQLEFHGRGTRDLTENTSFYVGAGVVDFDDDAVWVYGNLSGSVVYTRAGIEASF